MSSLLELLEQSPARRGSAAVPATLVPVLEDMARSFGSDRALVALVEPERRLLRGAFGLNLPATLVQTLEVPLAERGDPLVTALRTGLPQHIVSAAADARIGPHTREILIELGFEQFVVTPIHNESDGIGVILLARTSPFTEADVNALIPLAGRAGAELQRARDVELRGTSETAAVEKEWLWWMINAVADPVVVSDEQNEIVLQNRVAEKLFRAGHDDSPGRKRAVTMNNFLFTASLSTWNLQQGGGGSRPRELTLVDPVEGSDLMFEVIAVPATNYRVGQRGMVAVLKNVTDLRQVTEELTRNVQRLHSADQEIRLERDRLDLILRSVPNPIIVIDNEDQIVSMNAAAQRVFGAPTAPGVGVATGRRPELALRNSAKFTSFIAQLRLEPGMRKSGELALVDPETEEDLEMAVTSTEIRDDAGVPVATVSVMQDVGRLRELERRRLEQALFDSEKLAATGRLAASIAHEINNPLEAIQNSLYLLVNKVPQDDPNFKFLDIARKETERMSRILRQMLGFYRPAAAMQPTDVNALIDEAEALVAKRLRDRKVRLAKELDRELPQIIASADQLKQVILNLILNGAESMAEGGTITVSTAVYRDAGARFLRSDAIQIQIRDTGSGIAEEHMPHIFEPFFSTKGEKGTGLGLWVSNGIIQSHGGSLQVRSRVGQGTTFSITLPIGGPPADAA
ncbi:MAG TPA: ATP-binding protein [Candidatus Limnocylindria bacterium]|nr:ATP-binding protein [Candidatus Limnocylindria bacterium]